MNSKEYWGLSEAYAQIYRSQEIDEASALGGRVTGSNPTVYRQAERPAGTRRGAAAGTRRPSTPTPTPTAKPAPAAKPAPVPTARPAAPAPTARPAAPAPTARPASTRPAPTAKPAATTPKTSPVASSPRPKDTSITDMIGRSQIRQGAPINTGNKSSDVRSMALRGSAGSSTPTKTAPTSSNRATGSRKPGSIVSGFDMFDLVKGHLLDEGYADTEEAAIAIMANMSEEWRQNIIDKIV